jgi:hypothetical protein
MSTIATIAKNEVAVRFSERPDVGRDFLTIECPNGWDDVKKLTNKVLNYEGRKFTWCSWNSDRNDCTFVAPHKGSQSVATISTK